jgi:MoxR-like ATPase
MTDEQLQDWRGRALRVEEEVTKAVVGQQPTIRLINVALFARGHVLLEGDVGVGKTTILRAFARAIGGDFERVEGTVDLMPSSLMRSTARDRKCSRCFCARWPSEPYPRSTASIVFRT